MSHQKSIHSFFQKKEGAEAKEGGESPQPKRVKRSVEGEERNQCAVKEMLKAMVELRPACWKEALGGEFNKSYFYNLIAFLNKEIAAGKDIYPPIPLVFEAFNSCPLADVKVVILGQDPYHGYGQAHGLAFSVQPGVAQPPSLRNMIKEAEACCGIRPTKSGCLSNWTTQGVLLLNTVLTVERGKAFSHRKKGWENFTENVIRILGHPSRPPTVFLLWGKPSQDKGHVIDRTRHRIIKSSHPSPLANTKTAEPFTGSRCFARVNDLLQELGREPIIDWNL